MTFNLLTEVGGRLPCLNLHLARCQYKRLGLLILGVGYLKMVKKIMSINISAGLVLLLELLSLDIPLEVIFQ